jgi:hypothetical protein
MELLDVGRNFCVKLEYDEDGDGRQRITKATISCQKRNWKWTVSPRNFEVIHGMSRVVRLIPDKLATALAINVENHENDGTFLIGLVINLTRVYVDLSEANAEGGVSQGAHVLWTQIGAPEDDLENGLTLADTVVDYEEKLQSNRISLSERDIDRFMQESEYLVQVSDDLLMACHIYLDFIHPVWIEVNRMGRVDRERIGRRERDLLLKLEQLQGKLSSEFNQLMWGQN